jgi:hypothetical protein
MKRPRAAIVALAVASALYAHPRDPKISYDLIKKGSVLSAKDAEKLEDRLKKKTGDEEARIQLLSYYAGPPPGADLSAVREARSRHILWLIENDPKDGLGLFQISTGIYRVHCQGDDLADPDAFERASRAWLEQARKNPANSDIRRAAVDAIQYCSPEKAEQILTEGKDASGLGHLYASAILGITGESYRNGDPAGSDASFRARPFAEKARAILEAAADKGLVVAGARTLLRQGAVLWADGKLDWDYTAMGNSLLTRARNLAPDEITLVTLPTELPARGERPPMTITVGGNGQERKLVRKVLPLYPPVARDRGIEGTVHLTALIGLDGKIMYLRADAGPAELIPAAVEAVRQWEYQTTTLNGKPCYIRTRIDVNYVLSR